MKKKILSALLSAALCFSALSSAVQVRAAESGIRSFSDNEYKRAVSIAGIEYDPALAKLVEGYADKKSDKTVTYKNSLSKRALGKIMARAKAINDGGKTAISEGFFNAAAGKDFVLCEGRKGGRTMQIVDYAMAYYLEKGKVTSVTLDDGQKLTRTLSTSEYKSLLAERVLKLRTEYPDSLTAYVHRIEYKGKSYTLEMFRVKNARAGFLVDTAGNIAGAYDTVSGYYTFTVSYCPDEKLFDIPEDIEEVKSGWLEGMRLIDREYDIKCADLAEKAKKQIKKNKKPAQVLYKDSLTKKFADELDKRVSSGKKDYLCAEYNGDLVSVYARSGNKLLSFEGDRGYDEPQIFIDGKTVYTVYGESRTLEKYSASADEYKELLEYAKPDLGIKVSSNDKIKVYSFKYGGKTYTCEVSDINGKEFGFLFDSEGKIAGKRNPRYGGFSFIRYEKKSGGVIKKIEDYGKKK